MSAQVVPSHPLDTPLDHRSLLNVFSWLLLVVTAIIVLTRLGTRSYVTRSAGHDDILIVLSLIFAIGQTVAISNAVGNGLGLVLDSVPQNQLIVQEKSTYAALILFILSQSCSKSSVVFFIRTLTPVASHRRKATIILTATIVWALTAIFGFAFSCGLPSPWNYSGESCYNIEAFYTYVEAFSAIIDASLVILPVSIISSLQLASQTKFAVIAFFTSRTLVIVCGIAQIVFILKTKDGSRSFLAWTFVLILQMIQNLGIIAACGPYLKGLIQGLNTGMLGNDDLRRRTRSTSKLSSVTPKHISTRFKRAIPTQSTRATDYSSESTHTENELLKMDSFLKGSSRSHADIRTFEATEARVHEGNDSILHTTSYHISSS